jgi:hypothetical protein
LHESPHVYDDGRDGGGHAHEDDHGEYGRHGHVNAYACDHRENAHVHVLTIEKE